MLAISSACHEYSAPLRSAWYSWQVSKAFGQTARAKKRLFFALTAPGIVYCPCYSSRFALRLAKAIKPTSEHQ